MADARVRNGLLLGFAAYASWGLLSPVGKRLLLDFDPLAQNAVRFVLATAILLPILGLAAFRDGLRLLRRREIVVLNLVSHISLTMFIYSLRDLEPAHATLAFYSAPLWTALLARAMLQERVGALFFPASAGLLAGGYLALFGWAAPGAVDNLGLLIGILSAGVWG
ncbi:MAG TPA: DMT family transporter, partial [Candidatus Thermoplasmatota archaeon]|nr:DMT family transporter [Candidatus Thermoplasmatota archaeon]